MEIENKVACDEVKSLDDDGKEEEILIILSQENEQFPLPKKIAIMSELIKTMTEGDKDEKQIPLPNVKSAVLSNILKYMTYHFNNPAKEIQKPIKVTKTNKQISKQ